MAAIWSDVGLSRFCKSLFDGALDSDAVRTKANWALLGEGTVISMISI